jgi:hypothetical protein
VADLHAPVDAAHDGRGLVIREVDAAHLVQQVQQGGHHLLGGHGGVGDEPLGRHLQFLVGQVADVGQQARRDLFCG